VDIDILDALAEGLARIFHVVGVERGSGGVSVVYG